MATPREQLISDVEMLLAELGVVITSVIQRRLNDWVDDEFAALQSTVPALEPIIRVRKGNRQGRMSGMSMTTNNVKHVLVQYNDDGKVVYEDASDLVRL